MTAALSLITLVLFPFAGRLGAADPGTVLWSLEFQNPLQGPVLGPEGNLYVIVYPSPNATGPTRQATLLALSESAEVKWSKAIPLAPAASLGLTVSPQGWVFVASSSNLLAYDAEARLRFRYEPADALWVSIPAVGSDGNLYVTVAKPRLNLLARLTPSGATVWLHSVITNSMGPLGFPSLPVLGGDDTAYVRVPWVESGTPMLKAITSAGMRRWIYPVAHSFITVPSRLAVTGDGTILYSDYSDRSSETSLNALNSLSANPYGERAWLISGGPISANAGKVGDVAIAPDGVVYWMMTGRGLVAVHPSGRILWEFSTFWPIRGLAAVGRDGTAYFTDSKVLNAVNRAGKLRWSLPGSLYGSEAPVISRSGALFMAEQVYDGVSNERWRLKAIETGLTSPQHPWPVPRADARNSGRSPPMEPGTGFTQSRSLGDGSMEMLIEGPPSHSYVIEHSTDLNHWQAAGTRASSNGVVRVVAATPHGTPKRFFRIAAP